MGKNIRSIASKREKNISIGNEDRLYHQHVMPAFLYRINNASSPAEVGQDDDVLNTFCHIEFLSQ